MKILAINPGSTSTKLAIYEDGKPIWNGGAHLPIDELAKFHHIIDQYEYRRDFILKILKEESSSRGVRRIKAVIGKQA